MSAANHQAIPTLGYPSQNVAIVALYNEGREAIEIAELVGAPINSVHRTLAMMRKKQGLQPDRRKRRPARVSLSADAWPKAAHDWRLLNHHKATSGAREALEAMGQ